MPRLNIIVLDRVEADADGSIYNYVMWADVPVARQARYASSAKVSVWAGASSADNANLQLGAITEIQDSQRIPAGWTLAQIEASMQQKWTTYQSHITNYNPWQRYGTTWDGTTWTVSNNG